MPPFKAGQYPPPPRPTVVDEKLKSLELAAYAITTNPGGHIPEDSFGPDVSIAGVINRWLSVREMSRPSPWLGCYRRRPTDKMVCSTAHCA
jgi:hypothetical protein